ncbi:MAG TPA: S41 family peptidase [Gemmatimonadales bacterium]|jgi:carboxyl-terminal processing protease|nr:S41 family peptidase [Gemmatimonadales bacterium]
MRTGRAWLRIGAASLAIALSAAASAPLRAQTSSYEYLQAFSSVINFVRLNYVDSVGYPELVRAAIEGTLRSLDPHSRFVSAEEFARRSALERGELAIPGLIIEDVDSAVVVLSVYAQSPAATAGVQPGDRVVSVSDTTVAGQRAESVELRLAGAEGTRVKVTLERGPRLEPDSYSVNLKRVFPRSFSVTSWSMLDSATGYVRLNEFGEQAAEQLRNALRELRGKRARRLILDLRGNPGGLVIEAVDIASLFLPKGSLVFRTRGRKRSVDEDFVTKHDGEFALPLIVLIDEGSASASEALAGSLQDNDRALLLGRRSFGKALMQQVFIVSPTNDNVWLTIGRVITPSGRIIQRRYKGLLYEQYRSLAGHGGAEADTTAIFHTSHGREVRGGGGIRPDIETPASPALPVWFSIASDSGFDHAVADSVAATLPAGPAGLAGWTASPDRWKAEILPPFLARVRSRLRVTAATSEEIDRAIARRLATRAAEVRWGIDAARALWLGSDPDVRDALTHFPRLAELLAGPH